MLNARSGAKEGLLWFYAAWRLCVRAPGTLTLLGLICLLTPQAAQLIHQPVLNIFAHCLLVLLSYLFWAGMVYGASALDQGRQVHIGLLFEGQRLGLIGRIISVFCLNGALNALSFAIILVLMLCIAPHSFLDASTAINQMLSRLVIFSSQKQVPTLKDWQSVWQLMKTNYPELTHFIIQCFTAMILARFVNLVWMLSLPLVLFNRLSLQQAYRVSLHTICHHFLAVAVFRIISALVVYAFVAAALLIGLGTQWLVYSIHGGLGWMNILGLAVGLVIFLATYCFGQVFVFVGSYVVWKQLGRTAEEGNNSSISV